MNLRTALLLSLAAFGLAAPAASASTVTLTTVEADSGSREDLIVDGLPGERNRITITRVGATRLAIEDTGSKGRIKAPDCRATSRTRVVCPLPEFLGVYAGDRGDHVTLVGRIPGRPSIFGDAGDDVLRTRAAAAVLFGGTGNDRLTGAAGRDVLIGGTGRDVLSAGAGDDLLNGGDGDEPAAPQIADPDRAPDRIDGGRGTDTVTYAGRADAVEADLDAGRGGATGTGEDTLIAVERADLPTAAAPAAA